MKISGEAKKPVIEDSDYINETVEKIVNEHTKEMDSFVESVHEDLRQDVSYTDEQLSEKILKLNVILYDVIGPNFAVDIRQEISGMKQKSEYAFARKTAEGTVADKDNQAFLATQDISVLNLIYKEANKLMKSKVDRASELLLSLKKILTFRIQQMGGTLDQ